MIKELQFKEFIERRKLWIEPIIYHRIKEFQFKEFFFFDFLREEKSNHNLSHDKRAAV